MFSLVDIVWPRELRTLLDAIAVLLSTGSAGVLSIDCILNSDLHAPDPMRRLLFELLMPFAGMALLLLGSILVHTVLKASDKLSSNMSHRLEVAAFVGLAFYNPALVKATLAFFACYIVDYPLPEQTPYKSNSLVSNPLLGSSAQAKIVEG